MLLENIELDFDNTEGGDAVVVSVWSDSGGNPGSKLFDLSNPAAFSASGLNRFAAPPNTVLGTSATYYVHVTHSSAEDVKGTAVDRTSSDAEDTGSASGWSIANDLHYRSRPNFQFGKGAGRALDQGQRLHGSAG